MQILLFVNVLISVALISAAVKRAKASGSEQRAGMAKSGFGSALMANILLFAWLGMWKLAPPVMPSEYWKFLGCSGIAAALAAVTFISGWLMSGRERLILVLCGVMLGVLAALVGTLSIRVS